MKFATWPPPSYQANSASDQGMRTTARFISGYRSPHSTITLIVPSAYGGGTLFMTKLTIQAACPKYATLPKDG